MSGGLSVRVSLDLKELDRVFRDVPRKVVKPASVTAINKTLKVHQKKLIRNVSKITKIPTKIIKGRIKFYKATSKFRSGLLWMSLVPVPLIKLGKGTERGTGVRVGRKVIKGGFVATMPSGHEGIYKRRGPSRLPIDEQKIKIAIPASRAISRLELILPRDFMKFYIPEVERRLKRLKR